MDLSGIAIDRRRPFIEAAMRLLERSGPSEIKARSVALEAGGTTMGLYTQFSGIPELLQAIVDEGFTRQARIFAAAPKGDDPMANLYVLALACRNFAGNAPHLYDLMFGLSIHGRYNGTRGTDHAALETISPAFQDVFAYLLAECEHLLRKEPVAASDAVRLALQFWSMLHGFIMLDLAGHLSETSDPSGEILMPMCVSFVVGMGADRDRAMDAVRNARALWERAQGIEGIEPPCDLQVSPDSGSAPKSRKRARTRSGAS